MDKTGTPASTTLGQLVFQERYSGPGGADAWSTISFERYQALDEAALTERRVLQVVEYHPVLADSIARARTLSGTTSQRPQLGAGRGGSTSGGSTCANQSRMSA